jgi:hypothetical protein
MEVHGSKAREANYQDPLSTNKLGMETPFCTPSYLRCIGVRTTIQAWLQAKMQDPIQKNSRKEKGAEGVGQVVESQLKREYWGEKKKCKEVYLIDTLLILLDWEYENKV